MNPMFYFFLALTAVLATTANAAGGGPVLDTDGDFIFHGSYYVLPVFRGKGRGGGLTLASPADKLCPLDIVQAKSDVDNGIPVKFSNWRSRVGFVPESANLNIETDIKASFCFQSAYWWVNEVYQVATGPKPEAEENSLNSLFQIKKVKDIDAYKIVFCPKNCIDVGIYFDDNGVRRLALSSEPFLVRFKKANAIEDSFKTTSM